VQSPTINRHAGLGKGDLPGQDVGIDRVNQRPVQIEDQRFHSFPSYQIANDFPSEFVTKAMFERMT
jgi:hypothetical protein